MITATVSMQDMLNYDYARARKLILPAERSVNLVLVGCGGTGSWLAPTVARVGRLLIENFDKDVNIVFCDPDRVEEKNIYRQNFCAAEIGENKAETLAFRYGLAWGLEIQASPHAFSDKALPSSYPSTTVLIGCVDTPKARRSIAKAGQWWLDCGNHKNSGQVLLGSGGQRPKDPYSLPGFCSWLPSPALQRPELLEDEASGPVSTANLSCADLALLDSQSLSINQRIAAEASDFLVRMLVTRDLQRMAAYIDLAAGSARSVYITEESIDGIAVR